jgi:hypothetical protein
MFCNNKCIIWLKKYGKGQREWNKADIEVGLRPRKKIRLVFFFMYCGFQFFCLLMGVFMFVCGNPSIIVLLISEIFLQVCN